MDQINTIRYRIQALESQLAATLDDGISPDSYNVGWLEGAVYELRKLLSPGGARYLVLQDGDWICPDCGIWIDPTELGCGCGRTIPPA